MTIMKSTIAILAAASILAGCAPNSGVYSAGQQMQAQSVQYGTITGVNAVETRHIKHGDRVAGAIVGGVAGAAAGSQVGDGRGRIIATGLGAVSGAAAGDHLAQSMNRTASSQWLVTLDNGQGLAVIQNDAGLRLGARVAVIRDGRSTRLVAAN